MIAKEIKESLLIFLRGLFMGLADIIPGVSGGTIALITGIYEHLIKTIDSVNSLFLKPLAFGKFKQSFKNIKKFDFWFFIPLILGIAIAFLTLAHVMNYLLTVYTALTYAFFAGLILASAIFVYKHAGKNHIKNLFYLAFGFIFAFWFVGLNVLSANHSLIIIFFSGAIAICAMILPGISGAFILVLLNQYEFMITAIKNLLFDKIIVFGIGALIGLLSFSKLLTYLLKKHKESTMSFLTGLMLGSLRLPATKISGTNPIILLIVILIGFIIVFFIEKNFNK